MNSTDEYFMSIALKHAEDALRCQEVPVGCIFIYQEEIIASGRNTVNETHNATRHAEINCIDLVYEYCTKNKIESDSVFRNIDVFVTVEPCIMCMAALFNLNIKSVTYGCKNDRFGGETVVNVSKFTSTNCVIKGGYKSDQAMQLLKEFYKGTNPSAPPSKKMKS